MFKACSRCGKVHDVNFVCKAGRQKIDWNRYKTDADKLHHTAEWQAKSLQIREDAQWLCEVCRDQGAYNYTDLEVHHIDKLRENKAGLLDDNNLVCLCVKHHKQADRGQLKKSYLRNLAAARIKRVNDLTVI